MPAIHVLISTVFTNSDGMGSVATQLVPCSTIDEANSLSTVVNRATPVQIGDGELVHDAVVLRS